MGGKAVKIGRILRDFNFRIRAERMLSNSGKGVFGEKETLKMITNHVLALGVKIMASKYGLTN